MNEQRVEMLAPPLTAPPPAPGDLLWGAIAPLLTPSTMGAMALTIAVVHVLKVIASFTTTFDDEREAWVFFCTVLSMTVGGVVGIGFWLGGLSTWAIVPLCAFGSGPTWLLLQKVLPEKFADILLTDTDRNLRGGK